jgi:hypothetical protein
MGASDSGGRQTAKAEKEIAGSQKYTGCQSKTAQSDRAGPLLQVVFFDIRGSYSSSMPLFASSSAASLPGSPAWPLTHFQVIWCLFAASSRACHRSLFFTGFFADVFQPRLFQFGSHCVRPSRTYFESVCNTTLRRPFKAFRASIAAVSSIRLLVVSGSPPCRVLRLSPDISNTPQPPAPGLPLQAPSVYISTIWVKMDA